MLNKEDINKYKKSYENKKENKIMQRVLNKTQIVDLIQDDKTKPNYNFSIEINTHGVTSQNATGRCWFFAGLNILREKVIEKCELNNFELSANYITFFDKLERFNIYLERLMKYKLQGRDLYDRYVSDLLEYGIVDGGNFTAFANLIEKYGIVPKTNFEETYASSNTYEINLILSRLLRKFYIELNNTKENDQKIKDKYMRIAYNIVASLCGIPKEKFNFEYKDKNGKYHIDKNLTPKEFYNKYIDINLKNEYVEVISYEDERIKYNNIYEVEESSKMSGANNYATLNLPFDEFKNLILKSLQAKEVVYFYCSTTSKMVDGVWLDTLERYGELFGIDLKLDNNSILMTNGITNCHCMLITGVNIVDNKIDKWKIENSWGSKVGNNGYYVATDDFINNYVHKIVINKKYLNEKQLQILGQDKILTLKYNAKI